MLLIALKLENKKLHKANFCENKFCSMYSWILELKK